MILLNNHGKPELLWQTLRLSFASYDELIFHLKTLGGNSLHFGFNPDQSYVLLLGSGATMVLVFHVFKHTFKACFLDWHFLTTNISPCWRLIIHPLSLRPIAVYKRTNTSYCFQARLLSRLLAIRAQLRVHMRTEGVT